MKSDATLRSQSLGAASHQSLPNTICLNKIDDLPEFLLVEILCRLPCKFGLRCKCVCKSWSTLISQPYFESHRALYLRNNCDNEQVSELFTISKQSHPGLKPLNFGLSSLLHLDEEPIVVATYNDFILLCDTWRYQRNYYVCNPYTKQWVALPRVPRRRKDVHVGFTCDSDIRCCKVVRILGFKVEPETHPLEVEIFSAETGKWIKSDLVLQGINPTLYYYERIKRRISPVAHNGTLYWMTAGGYLIGLELFNKLNINSTKCHGRFISNPHPVDENLLNEEMVCVCQGCVRLCRLCRGLGRCSLYVWELKGDDDHEGDGGGSEWCLKKLVDLRPIISSLWGSYELLAFDPNDEDILYLWRINWENIRKLTVIEISQKFSSSCLLRTFPFVLPWWRCMANTIS
ncbi:putative F-box domain-containing protein [Rosa chinensis]|uniref:Putative F-box domain-containing protein n=1 Tax=Rosa chinensis TaxID=74649 RepID=A0A2P6PW98_ROSCH|nr:putative F-box domain-containing protein [Rosa chinensis]